MIIELLLITRVELYSHLLETSSRIKRSLNEPVASHLNTVTRYNWLMSDHSGEDISLEYLIQMHLPSSDANAGAEGHAALVAPDVQLLNLDFLAQVCSEYSEAGHVLSPICCDHL